MSITKEGDYLPDGENYEVCNVVGSSWDAGETTMKDFWKKNTPPNVTWPTGCQIKGCTKAATGGGHMWVKGRQWWFILPICQNCNTNPLYDDAPDKPGYTKTNKTAYLVARDNGGSKRLGKMEEGDFLWGQYDVSYEPKRGASPKKFWSENSGREFSNQKCQIVGCGDPATVAGRMRVYQLSKFQFLLPICDKCKQDEDLKHPKCKPTKPDAKLVAVNRDP